MDVPWAKVVTTACVVTWFNPQAIIDGTMMLGAFSRNVLRIINLVCGSVVIFYGGKLLWSFLQAVLPLLGA